MTLIKRQSRLPSQYDQKTIDREFDNIIKVINGIKIPVVQPLQKSLTVLQSAGSIPSFASAQPQQSVSQTISYDFSSFPGKSIVQLAKKCKVETIVIVVSKVFDVGAIAINDPTVIVDPANVDLTTMNPIETPLYKEYNAGQMINVVLTGSPTKGSLNIIFKIIDL